jgi:hypothetical protein
VIAELGRVVAPGGVLVLEYANKRNLKSIARRLLGRQSWSPFEPGAVEYKPLPLRPCPVTSGVRCVQPASRSNGCEPRRSSGCPA